MAYKYTGVDRSFFDYLRGARETFSIVLNILSGLARCRAIITIHPSRVSANPHRRVVSVYWIKGPPFHCVAPRTRAPVDFRNDSDDDKPRADRGNRINFGDVKNKKLGTARAGKSK